MIFSLIRTFQAAKYFTYNTGNSKCRCKPDMDMGAVRQNKTGRISGNVECEKAEPCYTEGDVQYKVENINMTNVDISEQDSAEECRANCRCLQQLCIMRLPTNNFFLIPGPFRLLSTLLTTRATPNADVSRTWTWMLSGRIKRAESLAMSNVIS